MADGVQVQPAGTRSPLLARARCGHSGQPSGSCSGCLKVRGACCGCEAPCEEPHLGTVPLEELLSPGCPLLCTTHGSGAAKLEKSIESKECDWFLDCSISLPHFCGANVEQLVFSVLCRFCWTGKEWLSFRYSNNFCCFGSVALGTGNLNSLDENS